MIESSSRLFVVVSLMLTSFVAIIADSAGDGGIVDDGVCVVMNGVLEFMNDDADVSVLDTESFIAFVWCRGRVPVVDETAADVVGCFE